MNEGEAWGNWRLREAKCGATIDNVRYENKSARRSKCFVRKEEEKKRKREKNNVLFITRLFFSRAKASLYVITYFHLTMVDHLSSFHQSPVRFSKRLAFPSYMAGDMRTKKV